MEIKIGGERYLESELKRHGKDQALANEGKSVILVSEDFKDMPFHKQAEIRAMNSAQGTTIIAALPRASQIDAAMKKAANIPS